jgi:hypothetical protein
MKDLAVFVEVSVGLAQPLRGIDFHAKERLLAGGEGAVPGEI